MLKEEREKTKNKYGKSKKHTKFMYFIELQVGVYSFFPISNFEVNVIISSSLTVFLIIQLANIIS